MPFFYFVLFLSFGQVVGQGKSYFFIHLADPQLGFSSGNSDCTVEREQMELLIKAINRLEPEFVVMSGDLVHDKDDKEQWAEFDRLCKLIHSKIPVYLLPGNHDVGNEASPRQVNAFIAKYGSDRFVWKKGGACVVGINTPVVTSGSAEQEAEQHQWLSQQLKKNAKSHFKIVVGHHPFFVNSFDEPDAYENVPMTVRQKYLDLFALYHVDLVLSGHLHRCAESTYKTIRFVSAAAAGRPLGKNKPGMQIVLIRPERVHAVYFEINRIPSTINLFNKR